jgi:hypothetical protein
MGSVTPRYYTVSALQLQKSLADIGLAGDFDYIHGVLHIEDCRMLSTIRHDDIHEATKQGKLKGTFEEYRLIFKPEMEKCTYESPDCEHMSVEDHTEKLFHKLDKHASKSQDVLDAEDLAAEMNDDVFLAEEALGQGNDFFAKVDAKAKAEAEEQVKVDADMHLALVEAEDALDKWLRVGEGRWTRSPVDDKTEPVLHNKWIRVGEGRWKYMN